MSNYRRAIEPGGWFFFTLVTHGRQPLFDRDENVGRLREGFRRTITKHPFQIDAIVILPDHLHTVWRLPIGDADFSLRWRLIKHHFAAGVSSATNDRGEKQVWQRRFWEHRIRDETDWRKHLDYVHYNPVKRGYVERPGDWRWSSFARAVSRGWYLAEWGASEPPNLRGLEFEESGARWNRCACSTLRLCHHRRLRNDNGHRFNRRLRGFALAFAPGKGWVGGLQPLGTELDRPRHACGYRRFARPHLFSYRLPKGNGP